MSALPGIGAVGALTGDALALRLAPVEPAPRAGSGSFAEILSSGMRQVEGKLATADGLLQRFALDDSVPVHQVTYALEEARLSVELAMQVRTRLVESYREIMGMQL